MREITALTVKARPSFVETPSVHDLTERALSYLRAGLPVHLCGPSGSGKTTLAFHIASHMGRPVMLICGDDEYSTSDLVGDSAGYSRRRVVDNFIHSVLKTEESMHQHWSDNRLTAACEKGYTLIYDEFTRSRPEANNVLLSVLEERMLALPTARNGEAYLKVHPNFAAIFTSNPEDYVGVHKTQDALLDRMVTMHLRGVDQEGLVAITCARTGVDEADAERIVRIVSEFRRRAGSNDVSIRACIMLGKVLAIADARATVADDRFIKSCHDVLLSAYRTNSKEETAELLNKVIAEQAPAWELRVAEEA